MVLTRPEWAEPSGKHAHVVQFAGHSRLAYLRHNVTLVHLHLSHIFTCSALLIAGSDVSWLSYTIKQSVGSVSVSVSFTCWKMSIDGPGTSDDETDSHDIDKLNTGGGLLIGAAALCFCMAVLAAGDLFNQGRVIPAAVRKVRGVSIALGLALLLGIIGAAVAGAETDSMRGELRSFSIQGLSLSVNNGPGLGVSIAGLVLCLLSLAASIAWLPTAGASEQEGFKASGGATSPFVAVAVAAGGPRETTPLNWK